MDNRLTVPLRSACWLSLLAFMRLVTDRADGGDPALAMGATIDPHDRPTNARFFALGPDAILGWTQSYLDPTLNWVFGRQPPGGGYRRRGELPIIGFWNPTNVEYPFVFAGDGPHYLEHLEVVH
jgi:hypothetical protein